MTSDDILSQGKSANDYWDQAVLVEVADVISRKWHLLILHQLMMENQAGINDLRSSMSSISNKMLSDGLDQLEDEGLISCDSRDNDPATNEYSLTDQGEALQEVIAKMLQWGHQHLDGKVEASSVITRASDGGQSSNKANDDEQLQTVISAPTPQFDDTPDPTTNIEQPSLRSVLQTLFGLTDADVEIFKVIADGSGMSIKTIAEEVGHDESHVSRSVRRLCDIGLVARRRRIISSGGHFFEHYAPSEEQLRSLLVEAVDRWHREATTVVKTQPWSTNINQVESE